QQDYNVNGVREARRLPRWQPPRAREEVCSMELGTFLFVVAFAYGIGIFWYDLLPAKLAERPWRGAADPFVRVVLSGALVRPEWMGPAFGGLHVVPLLLGSLLGVVVDWLVTSSRHPAAIIGPEMHARAA